MTRLITEGAEFGDVQFWDINHYATAVATPDNIASIYQGDFCFAGAWLGSYKYTGGMAEFYLRYRFRTNSNYSMGSGLTSPDIIGWYSPNIYDPNTMTEIGALTVDGTYRLAYHLAGDDTFAGIHEYSDFILRNDTWYWIEAYVKIHDTTGRITVKVDGREVLDFSGKTSATYGIDTYHTVSYIGWKTGPYCITYLDDLAVNKVAGVIDDSWCGCANIQKMTPDSNGAHNNWNGVDGDSIDNYLLVDEFPNDGDLTYVYIGTSSPGTQDQYGLSDLDYINKNILRIYPEARAKTTDSGGAIIRIGIHPFGGGDNVSGNIALETDFYGQVKGDEYLDNPVDSLPWEEADLDALEFVAEI